MKVFQLPDLGEGLPDAEIVEWHVNVGDQIKTDEPLVSMETAKAVVEVPSPYDGTISKLHGAAGDVIKTGSPLVEFASEHSAEDSGTVVGNIESSGKTEEDNFIIGSSKSAKSSVKATPAVRQLAKKMGVDLASISGSGEHGVITADDVKAAAGNTSNTTAKDDYTPLRGVRRAMVASMTQAHAQIVPVTIFDDAEISHWSEKEDITVRLVQAIVYACQQEPALNAWYDGHAVARKCHQHLDLGLAMDTADGLFVPVIKQADTLSDKQIRQAIDDYKISVNKREVAPENLKDGTFTLSNFGKFAGKYASPIIVPPTVGILGVGRIYQSNNNKFLPLSLSFDHRAVTGGEATRFLGEVMKKLGE